MLLAGGAAHHVGKQCGAWTLTSQVTGNRNEDFPNRTSIFDGIAETVAGHGSVLRSDGHFAEGPHKYLGVFVTETFEGNDGEERTSYIRVGAAFPHNAGMRFNIESSEGISLSGKLVVGGDVGSL